MAGAQRPRIDYFALGGTIASVAADATTGATPVLTAAHLIESLPAARQIADIRCHQFLQTSSPEVTFHNLLRLEAAIAAAVAEGSRGVVVTQGTDTLEETSFVLDLIHAGDAPVIFTGAMRNPSLPGSDGPANLLAAIQVAATDAARGIGTMVVFNDEIHAARFVRKTHTSSPSTFQSPVLGPIGWIAEGRPVIAVRPARNTRFNLAETADIPRVALIKTSLDDDGALLGAVAQMGYAGCVIEAYGGGHMRAMTLTALAKLASSMPVVLASRTGSGEVLSKTYRFPGSEIELLGMGLIRAGILDGLKARLLLTLALAARFDRGDIVSAFAAIGMTDMPSMREAG